ncbi:MAG: hypothetical protein AB1792_08065 [Candidatus Zixiibacteriota bacterium]
MDWHAILVFAHVITVVFMSVPLYNLVVVNERARMGKDAGVRVDRYFEAVIRGGARRCFVFQLTALLSGIALVVVDGIGFQGLWSDAVLSAKTVILFLLMGLLSHIHFSVQPGIDALLASVTGETVPADVAAHMAPFRLRRKRLAAVCLFLLITEVALGMQVFSHWTPSAIVVVEILAGLFAWRAYKSVVPFGWV